MTCFRYFFYNFSSNISKPEENFDTVVLKIHSDDPVCMTVSIQNASVSCSIKKYILDKNVYYIDISACLRTTFIHFNDLKS